MATETPTTGAAAAGAAAAKADEGTKRVVDHLEEDLITVPGQRFALVSFVSPVSRQKTDQCGMKIRGVFATREEATAHVRRLQQFDPLFDVFMLEVGKWVCVPPDIEKIEDVQYQEKYLQELISGYKTSQDEAKRHFQERKMAVMESGLDANLDASERITPPENDPHPSTFRAPITGDDGAGPSTSSS
jgi:hypothetical protein